MIGIVIVANGNLACELLASLEQILGHQEGVVAIAIEDSCDRKCKEQEICAAARRVDQGAGVVVTADIFGGSPMNLAKPTSCTGGCEIVSGVNLPMLIALCKARMKPLGEAADIAVCSGRKYIVRTKGIAR